MAKYDGDFYRGRLVKLKRLVDRAGLIGDWTEEPNGVRRFKVDSSASFHWAQTTHRLWFDGPEDAKQQLRKELKDALGLIPAEEHRKRPRSSIRPPHQPRTKSSCLAKE